jgi:hypothetical protein
VRLIDGLPEEEAEWLVSALRERAAQREQQAHGRGHAFDFRDQRISSQTSAGPISNGASLSHPSDRADTDILDGRRWPALGPGALGAAVILGWLAGMIGGPLLAIVGAVAGVFVGGVLDRRTEAERTAT